jgi:hypothetical protein
MAFFETLGKKLSDFGQTAAQKTKDLTEITKRVAANADRNKKISQLYTEIGAAYYNAHKDDALCESADKIAEITGLMAEIAVAQAEIDQIKGITKCPNCGADVAAGNVFCNACGAKVVGEAAAEEAAPESAEE